MKSVIETAREGIYLMRFKGRYGKSYKLSYPDVDEIFGFSFEYNSRKCRVGVYYDDDKGLPKVTRLGITADDMRNMMLKANFKQVLKESE